MPKKACTLKALACALGLIFIAPQALAFDNLNQDLQRFTLDPKVSELSSPFILIDDDDDDDDDRWERRRPSRGDRDDRWDDDDDDDRWERRRPPRDRDDRWDDDDDDDRWERRRPPRDRDDRWERDNRRFDDRWDDDRFDDRWDNDYRRPPAPPRPPRGWDNRHHPEPFHGPGGFRHHREAHHFFL